MECKICDGDAPLHGVVDFNRSCEKHRGLTLPLTGIPVWYHRCTNCGFLFTTYMDYWTPDRFTESIYNDEYIVVDPDYADVRPRANAAFVKQLIDETRSLRTLDYGSGSGLLATLLSDIPGEHLSYDPFWEADILSGQFDLVTAFEVFEHTTDPIGTVTDVVNLMAPGGSLFFSTLCSDRILKPQETDWWYIAPRNGHVSIYSEKSLAILFAKFGLKVQTLAYMPNYHLVRKPK